MIAHLKHDEINKTLWDNCINSAFMPLPYALSWYLDMVAPGWEALVLNNYQAVMPLPCRKKYTVNYIFTPPFVQQLGVFGPTNTPVDLFINALPAKFGYVDLNFNEGNEVTSPIPNTNTLLNLNKPFEELYKAFAENTRRNAKKAEKAGYTLVELNNPDAIITLFKQNKGKEVDADYPLLTRLVKAAQQHKACAIYGVAKQGAPVDAGAVFIKTDKQYVFLFSGNNEEARKNGAMHLLITKFIEAHAGQNAVLDFEGSNNKTLARFYLSFGGYATTYPKVKINRLPLPLRVFKK